MKVGRFVLLAMLFVFLNANLGCIYTACDMYIPGVTEDEVFEHLALSDGCLQISNVCVRTSRQIIYHTHGIEGPGRDGEFFFKMLCHVPTLLIEEPFNRIYANRIKELCLRVRLESFGEGEDCWLNMMRVRDAVGLKNVDVGEGTQRIVDFSRRDGSFYTVTVSDPRNQRKLDIISDYERGHDVVFARGKMLYLLKVCTPVDMSRWPHSEAKEFKSRRHAVLSGFDLQTGERYVLLSFVNGKFVIEDLSCLKRSDST